MGVLTLFCCMILIWIIRQEVVMQLTEEQFNEIQDLFPKPRGNVRWGHRRVLNGILYILEHGCP